MRPDECNNKTPYHYWDSPEIVQQYIGTHDKNVKEIYEGDILQYSTLMYQVKWNPVYCNIEFPTISNQEGIYHLTIGMVRNESEIIGNILENPNLINMYF